MATPTQRSTKKEIWDAYQAVIARLNQGEAQKPEADEQSATPGQAGAAVKLPELLSVEQVIENVADLKLRLSSALNNLSDQLTEEVGRLGDVRAEVAKEKAELETVYRIKAEGNALLALLELHETKRAELAKEAVEAQERLRLESEEKRRLWAREGEAYDYALAFKHKKEADEYEFKRRERERAFLDELAGREKAFVEREAALAGEEQSVEALKGKLKFRPNKATRSAARRDPWFSTVKDFVYFYDFYILSATFLAALVIYLIASG